MLRFIASKLGDASGAGFGAEFPTRKRVCRAPVTFEAESAYNSRQCGGISPPFWS
jgi:hypothetical protein